VRTISEERATRADWAARADSATRADWATGEESAARAKWLRDIAALLDRDEHTLGEEALLVEDLGLDSLSMLSLLSWLETHGIVLDSGHGHGLTSLGDVLSLLAAADSVRPDGRQSDSVRPDGRQSDSVRPDGRQSDSVRPDGRQPGPELTTQAFRLTPIQPSDLNFLYALAAMPETSFRWRYRGAAPTYDQFVADLTAHVLVQYVARRTGDNEPVGLVVAYAGDPLTAFGHLGAVFAPEHTGTGLAAQVVELFVRYVFHTFPLRKLYLEVPGFNWPQVKSGAGRLFQVEGVLRGHDYYAGHHWDKYVCAVYPEPPG
jgi:RimJ/RimL family protein N-acetyltransferase/aryl carrier-like protein